MNIEYLQISNVLSFPFCVGCIHKVNEVEYVRGIG